MNKPDEQGIQGSVQSGDDSKSAPDATNGQPQVFSGPQASPDSDNPTLIRSLEFSDQLPPFWVICTAIAFGFAGALVLVFFYGGCQITCSRSSGERSAALRSQQPPAPAEPAAPAKPAAPAEPAMRQSQRPANLEIKCDRPCWLEIRSQGNHTSPEQLLFYGLLKGTRKVPFGRPLSVFSGRTDLVRLRVNNGPWQPFVTATKSLVGERRLQPPDVPTKQNSEASDS